MGAKSINYKVKMNKWKYTSIKNYSSEETQWRQCIGKLQNKGKIFTTYITGKSSYPDIPRTFTNKCEDRSSNKNWDTDLKRHFTKKETQIAN